jgi:hypothetical protein
MGSKKHTRDSIIQALQGLANRLRKNTLSKNDIAVHLAGHLPASSINYHLGSLGNALEAAGLERTLASSHLADRGNVYSDDELFRSLEIVQQAIGHEPRRLEYESHGQYSTRPFSKRFGKWDDVLTYYRK